MRFVQGKLCRRNGVKLMPLIVWDLESDNSRTHQVAWVRTPYSSYYLVCECDFKKRKKPYVHNGPDDPNNCSAKRAVEYRGIESSKRYYAEYQQDHTLEESIEYLFQRVESGQFLGLRDSVIYAQHVGQILAVPLHHVLSALEILYAQDKIELNGMILCRFQPRFRFPKEIQGLLCFMIDEPLGWPNGDAGDCFVHELEKAVHDGTNFKHGRDAFGYSGNWPRLSPHIKMLFGQKWVGEAIMSYMVRAAQGEEKSQGKLDEIAVWLETLLKHLMTGKSRDLHPEKDE